MSVQLINNSKQKLLQILLKPHISEKSTRLSEKYRQFVFKVVSDASKPEIKQAVETIFNVEVKSVRICNVKSKVRRFKQVLGSRKGWKKAYVALKTGHDIDFVGAK